MIVVTENLFPVNTRDMSLDDVTVCDRETGYLPDRKPKWYVSLTWGFTLPPGHQPIFLTTRPYKPLMRYASLKLQVRTTRGHWNPYVGRTIWELRRRFASLDALSGVCKCLLSCQRISAVLSHLAPNTITLQMLNIFTKWAISCKVGWKLHLPPSPWRYAWRISHRAREGAEGGEVASPDPSYLKKRRDVSPQLFRKRDRTLLAHFYMKDFCEMIANLCKKAISDSFIMHEQRDTNFATLSDY